jgi:predicted TPR repeat methyltransferase
MTCGHCCDSERFFDEKEARKKQKKFLKSGADKATRKLIEAIKQQEINSASLLDIGGGVGAISFSLLNKEVDSVIGVDASPAYINVVMEEAEKRKLTDRFDYHHGDFTDLSGQLKTVDIVTLDKVVCCYPDVDKLLGLSLEKSTQYYGLVFPKGGMLSKLLTGIANTYLKWKKSEFRTYIHDPKYVHSLITQQGFERVVHDKTFVWNIMLYKKSI